MIKKLDIISDSENCVDAFGDTHNVAGHKVINKINELVDAVNELHAEAENNARIRANHENLIDTLVAENNIHEKQIDELQKKVEPEKCEIPVDLYAEQRKWIGKACWFWDGNAQTKAFGQLNQIDPLDDGQNAPYQTNYGQWYEHCDPVKPGDDIIYKGEQ